MTAQMDAMGDQVINVKKIGNQNDIVLLSPEAGVEAMQTIPVLLALIENCFKNGYYKIIIDMARIKFPSSSFIALLIELTSKARRAGGDLKLLNLAPSAINNLVTFNILNYLASETNIHTAIEELDELKLKPLVATPESLPDVSALVIRESSESTRPVSVSQTTPRIPPTERQDAHLNAPSAKPQFKSAETTRPVPGAKPVTVQPATTQQTNAQKVTAEKAKVAKESAEKSTPQKTTAVKLIVEKTTHQRTTEQRVIDQKVADQKKHQTDTTAPNTRSGNGLALPPRANLESTRENVATPSGKGMGPAAVGTHLSEKTPPTSAEISARSPSKPEGNRIRVKSKVESLYEICDFVTEYARQMGFPEKELGKIKVTIYEAALNIIEHAYHSDPDEWIVVSVQREGQKMTTVLQDWGERFQFDDSRQYNVDQAVKDRKTGGFGLFIIRRSMDEVKYKTDPVNGNRLILIKELR